MTRKDVEDYIREKYDEPVTVTAEDLKPKVCTWCGTELTPDREITVWDIPEAGENEIVWRFRYCSEDCKEQDRNAVRQGLDAHPYGVPERLNRHYTNE